MWSQVIALNAGKLSLTSDPCSILVYALIAAARLMIITGPFHIDTYICTQPERDRRHSVEVPAVDRSSGLSGIDTSR